MLQVVNAGGGRLQLADPSKNGGPCGRWHTKYSLAEGQPSHAAMGQAGLSYMVYKWFQVPAKLVVPPPSPQIYREAKELLTASWIRVPCLGACFSLRNALISTCRTLSLVTCIHGHRMSGDAAGLSNRSR